MYRLMTVVPALVVISSLMFNVFYFCMALQMGRISHNSIIWIAYQLPTLYPAIKGDLMPFFQVQATLRT
jgi:hypothetical protein